jgi:hypothetical protein
MTDDSEMTLSLIGAEGRVRIDPTPVMVGPENRVLIRVETPGYAGMPVESIAGTLALIADALHQGDDGEHPLKAGFRMQVEIMANPDVKDDSIPDDYHLSFAVFGLPADHATLEWIGKPPEEL